MQEDDYLISAEYQKWFMPGQCDLWYFHKTLLCTRNLSTACYTIIMHIDNPLRTNGIFNLAHLCLSKSYQTF